MVEYKNRFSKNRNNPEVIKEIYNDISNLSFSEVVEFIKVTNCYNSKLFWESEILKNHPSIFTSEISDQLLSYFFYRKEPFNSISHVLPKEAKGKYIYFFKISKSFLNESFSQLAKEVSNISYEEYQKFNYIIDLKNNWNSKLEYYKTIVSSFKKEDLLIHVVSLFEKHKRVTAFPNSSFVNYQAITANLLSGFNFLLSNLKPETSIYSSLESIIEKYKKEMPPLNPPEGFVKQIYLPKESISDEKKIIREAIDFFILYKIIDYRIDLYCSGYCNLDVYHQSLIPTKSVLNHQINDKKAHFSEVYFYNRAISSWEFKKEKNKNFLISNTPLVGKIASKEYLKFLGIPFELNYNQEKIDLRDVLNVLYEFSYNLMPEGRIFF